MKKYFINLKRSSQRRKKIEEIFSDSELIRVEAYDGRKLKYYSDIILPEKYPHRHPIGCSLSHIKAIIMSYMNNDSEALIIEDDMSDTYSPLWDKSIDDIVLGAPRDCELISFYTNSLRGLKILSTLKSDYCRWSRLFISTGCYYINRAGMRKIYNLFYKNGKIDLSIKLKNYVADDGVIYNNLNSYIYTKPTFINILFKSTIKDGNQGIEAREYIQDYFENKKKQRREKIKNKKEEIKEKKKQITKTKKEKKKEERKKKKKKEKRKKKKKREKKKEKRGN